MTKPYYLLEVTDPQIGPVWLDGTHTKAGPGFTVDVHEAWHFTSSTLAANALRRLTEQYGASLAKITITEHIDMDPTNEPIDPGTPATPDVPPGHRFGATIGTRLLLAGEAVISLEESLAELRKNADQASLAGSDLDDETYEVLRVAFAAAKRTQPPDDLLARLAAVLPTVMPMILSALESTSTPAASSLYPCGGVYNPCPGDASSLDPYTIDPYPESPGHYHYEGPMRREAAIRAVQSIRDHYGYGSEGIGTIRGGPMPGRIDLVPGSYFEPIVDEDGADCDIAELDVIGSRAGLLGTGRWILPTDEAWTGEGYDLAAFRILYPEES